jgi:uncharacterized membrane protein YdjX (TVP38/TMEM64 family)
MMTGSPGLGARGRFTFATFGAALGVVLAFVLLWLLWNRTSMQSWTDAGVLPFFVSMAALPAIGIPITPFFLAAGAAFGTRIGVIGSLVALGANLTLCYWIARSGLKSRIARLMTRLGYVLPTVDANTRGIRFTLLVKLTPLLPAFAKNYLLGIVGVPFVPYWVLSMLITGAYGVAVLVLGESVLSHDVDRGLVLAVAIVVVPLAVWLWRRRR